MRVKATIHVMLRIWAENGSIISETEFCEIHCEPELVLDLPPGQRSEYDWLKESLSEIINMEKLILPPKFEVCWDVIFYEAIGIFTISGGVDYWGEYDEDYDFDLLKWSADLEDE